MQALEKAALEIRFYRMRLTDCGSRQTFLSFESDVADFATAHKRVRKDKKKRGIVFMFPRWQVAASIFVHCYPDYAHHHSYKKYSAQKSISSVNKNDTQQVIIHSTPALVQSSSDTIKLEKETAIPDRNSCRKDR